MLGYTFITCALFIGSALTNPISVFNTDGINYELYGGGFEGDMIFPDGYDPTKDYDGRGAAAYGPRQWPNNIVPYDLTLITNAAHRTLIEQAMATLTSVTSSTVGGTTKQCVGFRPKSASDRIFLKVQYGTGCSASVGYGTGERRMTLQDSGCFRSGTIQHELIHVLGFHHEQSRPDRDTYITVNYANIELGKEHNFNKYTWGSTALNQNTPYDYVSIMHYGPNSFSKNGQPTIVPKDSTAKIGQRDKLSAGDIAEIRAFYSCS
ncbi:unnamed protein product [Adineta ricciae]|uniref:Metalloendopeptidase n=1 Tax=Adineta ricciae TaxID=249248 RepID=A0A813PES0_ADIRI|nr:unnamed protein product [Adineta ricciae]CAF0854876.1 unnamed protein product [Adineta ricciae]